MNVHIFSLGHSFERYFQVQFYKHVQMASWKCYTLWVGHKLKGYVSLQYILSIVHLPFLEVSVALTRISK
jgi:hypothetical protein